MTAAAGTQQKDVLGINRLFADDVIDRVLDVLLGKKGAARLVADGVFLGILSAKFGKQEVKIMLLCKGKHIVDLIEAVKAPCV